MNLATRLQKGAVHLSDGCILWRDGQPQIQSNGTKLRVQLVAWVLKNGPIPPSLFLQRRCNTVGCINTKHYTLTSSRGPAFCKRGHELTLHDGEGCRVCRNQKRRMQTQKVKSLAAENTKLKEQIKQLRLKLRRRKQ